MEPTNKAIMDKLDQMMEILSQMNKEIFADQLMDENEFCSLLNITRKTAKAMRDRREIEYAPLGRRIYYRTKDVAAMFDKAFESPKIWSKKKKTGKTFKPNLNNNGWIVQGYGKN